MEENNDLSYVTEVGVFGSLDIDDPTVIEMTKKKKKEMDDLIQEAIEENKKNLKGK